MMTAPKITFIGAGSTIFVKNILGDVFHREALKTAHIALMDIDPTRLEESHIVVRKLMDSAGASGKITCHTQRTVLKIPGAPDQRAILTDNQAKMRSLIILDKDIPVLCGNGFLRYCPAGVVSSG